MKPPAFHRTNAVPALLTLLFALTTVGLRADTQYWDVDGDPFNNDCITGFGLGGTGNWNKTLLAWSTNDCQNQELPTIWADGNDAVFWGTGGIVTLGANRTVGNLTFMSDGYEITSKTLKLDTPGGGNITNYAGTTTIISSILDGTNGFAKYGPGTLRLNNGANSVSNALYVYEGLLRLSDYTVLAANHVGQSITVDGGTLRNDSGSVGGYFLSRNVTLHVGTNDATINTYNANGILLYSNNILGVVEGQGVLTKQGAGEIRIFGPDVAHNTYGKLVIANGTFTAGQSSYPGYADTFCRIPETNTADAITIKNGAQMRLVGGANVTLDANQGITIINGGGVIAAVGGRTLTIPGSISGGNNWLEFNEGDTGTVSLRGANELGPVTNSSGVLLVRNSAALGDTTFGTTILNGATLAVSTTVEVPEPLLLFGTGTTSSPGALRNNANLNTWSGPITLGESGVRIDSAQGTLTLAGGVSGEGYLDLSLGGDGKMVIATNPVVLGGGTLTKDGNGTLSLVTTNDFGAVLVNSGTLLVENAEGSATGSGAVTVAFGATLGGNGAIAGPVTLYYGASIGGGASAGILTLNSGLDLSLATNTWELAADSDSAPGADFDQIILTGGELLLGSGSVLQLQFTGAATAPDLTNAFWQAPHQWKIVSISGTGSNPGGLNFGSIEGTNDIVAGTFSTAVDMDGSVLLSYTPSVVVPPPPVLDGNIVDAGTANAQISWSSVEGIPYRVLYKDDLKDAEWSVLTNLSATGSSTTIKDETIPVPEKRFYRIVTP